jgi:hypothetical protein
MMGHIDSDVFLPAGGEWPEEVIERQDKEIEELLKNRRKLIKWIVRLRRQRDGNARLIWGGGGSGAGDQV